MLSWACVSSRRSDLGEPSGGSKCRAALTLKDKTPPVQQGWGQATHLALLWGAGGGEAIGGQSR